MDIFVRFAWLLLIQFKLARATADSRLSPFWVYITCSLVDSNVTLLDVKNMEISLQKAYTQAERQKIGHGLIKIPTSNSTVSIAKVVVSLKGTVHTFVFYVRSNSGIYLPSPYVVQTLSRLDRQQLAISLGVLIVNGPGVYDLEANQPVDDRFWLIGVAFAILITALILGWLITFVYYNVCLASVMHFWIQPPNKDAYENQSFRDETNQTTDNVFQKNHVRLEKATILQYVENQSFSIERNLEAGQNGSAINPVATSGTVSNQPAATVPIKLKASQLKRKKSHLKKTDSLGRGWKSKPEDDLVSDNITSENVDFVSAAKASSVAADLGVVNETFLDDQQEREANETKLGVIHHATYTVFSFMIEPELLQPTPFGSECLSDMRPIMISRGARPEAVEMLGLTYSIAHDEVGPTV
ncbi:hypothetical protein P879_07496 [Paragonimus westermani]|uniref:Uncharacterized protein n=1 Tax=Paragonimus westermani TaxID=34504 RepID=A0A8T0CY75_9TREM|nr:hypothetical protein P879_07496 [Paragonimus westermani]